VIGNLGFIEITIMRICLQVDRYSHRQAACTKTEGEVSDYEAKFSQIYTTT